MMKYGTLGWLVGSTRYSPPGTLPAIPHPGYTPAPPAVRHRYTECSPQCPAGLKEAVGLKSVDQLSLCTLFSGFEGMTEVYNLSTAGIPNDHFSIPGNE